MKISATIITFNEERNIERCILSLLEVADEILVLDSFSTDKTEEICKKHGVKFIQRAWEGYSATKNHANQLAEHNWILSIDADEALSDELKKSILNQKNKLSELEAYQFNRLTNYCGKWIKHSGWYPDKKTRLFNRAHISWAGGIHETLIIPPRVKIKKLEGDLLHYSYYTVEEHIRQTEKFTSLSAQALYEKNKKPTMLKLYLSPIITFLKNYLFRLGFLDGYYGFLICKISAQATHLKYLKLQKMHQQ
ncbi:MAG: glycosyltransferase family 2 protein [Bacteroidetes bacterium]|nr:glycosyltransferase family 2 protein [Bacteroidota bacterium]